jgi:hypothetical protein
VTTGDLAVDVLAAARLTRLITTDTVPVVRRSREWIRRRSDYAVARGRDDTVWTAAAELVGCPWCVSIWTAVLVTGCRRLAPRWWAVIGRLLAVAALAGAAAAAAERIG